MSHVRPGRSVLPVLRLIACIVLVTCVHRWAVAAAPDEPTSLERRVKAAYLYKFAGFVEWPDTAFPGAESPFTIAVAGDDQMISELTQLTAGRVLEGRSIAVKRVREGDSLAGVQIIFIGRAEAGRINSWMRGAQGRRILTVTESDGGFAGGSVINFVLVDGRVRFEIALEPADKNKLVLSSRLLAVAHAVRPRTP